MSQFPADAQKPGSSQPEDPFDELARLINGGGTRQPSVAPAPTPDLPDASSDHDIQAAMEGRPPAPKMPVFDPTAPIAEEAAPVAGGVHTVPSRGPLARVSQEPAVQQSPVAEDESPLDAVFDLTALRAAFSAPAAVEAPVSSIVEAPVSSIAEAPVAEAAPIAEPAPAPFAFDEMPVASVPETDRAEIVTPPEALAPVEPAPAMYDEMRSLMSEESTPSVVSGGELELQLENELEAALLSGLEAELGVAPEPARDAPAMHAWEPDLDAQMAVEAADIREPAPRKAGASLGMMALAASVAVIGGGAALAYTMLGSGDDVADAPVILAAAGPAKVRPADAGGAKIANRDTALFKEKAGASHQEALRTGSEKPVEVAARPIKVKTSLKRAVPDTARKVRTVVVKPDGTIVSDDTVVGAVTPRVVKTAAVAKPKPIDQAPVAKTAKPKTAEPKTAKPAPVEKAAKGELDWGNDAKGTIAPAKKAKAAPKPVKVAKAEPAPKPAAKPVVKSNGGYVVQISSRRSPESARTSFAKLQKRYGSVLGGRDAEFQKTEIDGKGTFYRVRVLASSKKDARSLCSNLKRAGGSCFVTK